jgi:hypothetical protein
MQFDGIQNSIPEDAAQKRQCDVLVQVVRGWRGFLAILRALLTLPLGRPLSRCQLTDRFLTVPSVSTAIQKVDDLRDGQRHEACDGLDRIIIAFAILVAEQ